MEALVLDESTAAFQIAEQIDPASHTVRFEEFDGWRHSATSIAEAVAEALGLSVA